jgi:hypothetical protein
MGTYKLANIAIEHTPESHLQAALRIILDLLFQEPAGTVPLLDRGDGGGMDLGLIYYNGVELVLS